MKYCLSVLLLLISVNAHAELHKWVDAAGNVHYSDGAPPAAAKEQQLAPPSSPAVAPNPPGTTVYQREADLKKELKKKQETEQQQAQQQQQAEARRKNCEDSRTTLRSLQDAPRVVTYDANGNQVFMDDATRQQKIDEARQAVSEYCN